MISTECIRIRTAEIRHYPIQNLLKLIDENNICGEFETTFLIFKIFFFREIGEIFCVDHITIFKSKEKSCFPNFLSLLIESTNSTEFDSFIVKF